MCQSHWLERTSVLRALSWGLSEIEQAVERRGEGRIHLQAEVDRRTQDHPAMPATAHATRQADGRIETIFKHVFPSPMPVSRTGPQTC